MTTPAIEAETFIRADPARIAAVLADPAWQARWTGGFRLLPYEDRGVEGVRAVVTGVLTGSCEWWIEARPGGGAVVHFWLRTRPPRRDWLRAGPLAGRRDLLHRRNVGRRWRTALFRLKDELEGSTAFPGRTPGSS